MDIKEIREFFEKNKWFKVRFYNDIIYLFAYNSLQLGRIEKYNDTHFICYYRVGKNNSKEHNLLISDKEDLKMLLPNLISIFDREYGGKIEVISNKPEQYKGKLWFKTQKLYSKKIPKKEYNLNK